MKKYWLVVGANSDIAKAVVKELAKEGYNFFLASRNTEELKRFVRDLKVRFPYIEVHQYMFDVCDLESHKDFYLSLPAKPIGVIMAVGYLPENKEIEENCDKVMETIKTNYLCPVCFLNLVAQDFKKQNKGYIVGISSVAGDRSRKRNFLYASSKSGLTQYLDGLRLYLSDTDVKVINVKPGYVRTKMTKDLNLPEILTVSSEKVAKDIVKAIKSGKGILYTPWYWKYIMFVIRTLPEFILKRLNF